MIETSASERREANKEVRSWNKRARRSHLRWPETHGSIHSQGEPLGACSFC